MLTYCYGSNVTLLADHLLQEIWQHPPENILQPETIVVQNHGMAHWLSLLIAEREGVAANLQFEFPAERIWSLIRMLNPEIPQRLPSDLQPMAWALMKILNEEEGDQFAMLHEYIEGGNEGMAELRRWKLARRIADVFDQYLTYRPEMILSWEQKQLVTKASSERWQLQLWNRLQEYWQQNTEGNWNHQAALYHQLLSDVDNSKYNREDLPERITVFGINSMPPVFLKTLVKLSRLTEVHFYQVCPDTTIITPLQQSLGQKSTDFRQLLNDQIEEIDLSDSQVERKYISGVTEANTLFQHFKKSIENGEESVGAEADKSIQIHSCHSAMREVEVLYDQLLAFMDENSDINPSDILIMTPDIETYAPLVEAVFQTPEEELPKIPFQIIEQTYSGYRTVIQAFSTLLKLVQSRFKATEVFDFISQEPVRERFGLSDEDLNTLERWIDETGIRWGIDGNFKKEQGLPGTDYVTWKSGLQQMLLGFAMREADDRLFREILPYREIEGTQNARLAGTFSKLLNTLFDCYDQAQKSESLSRWSEILLGWIDFFIADEEEYMAPISYLRDTIQRLSEMQERGIYSDKVSFTVIESFLETEFQQQSYSRYSGQGVTFSSIVAMHNIPHKVVGIVGLNEGSFPRSKIPAEFDLIAQHPKAGDRIQRVEDRQLLFEALLSADQKLYLSYVGQSNRQDAHFPPSVVVRELTDYLEKTFDVEAGDLITEHPLQAFSKPYFSGEKNKLFSYSHKQCRTAQMVFNSEEEESAPFISKTLPSPDESFRSLSVNDLVNFYQHPAKFLLHNRLGVFFKNDETLDEDREPFQLDNLGEYQLGQQLLNRYLKKRELQEYEAVAHSKNMLPEGWPGHRQFEDKAREVEQFGTYLDELLQEEEPTTLEVDLNFPEFKISGKLTNIYPDAQVLFRFGKARAKDLVEFWIRHLLFQMAKPESHSGKSLLIAWENSVDVYELNAFEEAKTNLLQLLEDYWKGLQQAMPFFPQCSHEFARQVIEKEQPTEKALDKARNKWINEWGYSNEGEDPYNMRLFEHYNPFEDKEFQRLSKQFWKPFFTLSNKEKSEL